MVQKDFDQGVYTSIMSSPNAELIAVSLAFLKDPKNLLQKVVKAL